MTNKMLIDAVHPEETRVVVVSDKKVEDFDFEAASKKPLRGNIYLAKVTRVEPSLQAAFIEYGGNRHGFLAFSEIHPDYYQIPQADRAALLEDERDADEEDAAPKAKRRSGGSRRRSGGRDAAASEEAAAKKAEPDAETNGQDEDGVAESRADEERDGVEASPAEAEGSQAEVTPQTAEAEEVEDAAAASEPADADAAHQDGAAGEATAASAADEATGDATQVEADAADEAEEASAKATPSKKQDEAKEQAGAKEQNEAETAAAKTAADDEAKADEPAPEAAEEKPKRRTRKRTTKKSDDGLADPMVVEGDDPQDEVDVANSGDTDALEEIPERKRRAPRRNYKIQEVIKRRQILLVQVVKEERGTKGAALTTYLSLAGRYSVLMPNTDRGGGVSRKITDNADRKRLKSLVAELDVPEGMGIILRTAGASRTKTEIKRDFEYLLRLWESVRDLTLKSIAPELVYEEGNLVKRSIRDLYSKEIEEVLVTGDNAYREAKDFMKMLMPSHAKNVKPYREATPIFTAYAVEGQLDAMFSPEVTLPSKGYIVINPTEALISIDVNSGRSTKESNIEDTALKTNLEAADEVARQLRLRDLAGLIVIDFIDMDEKRHNRQVEKRLKDALKRDRSRIQVGRISPFGLMEMSRQRIRQGMVETSMVTCETCGGTGHVRSTQSVALHCLRVLEEHLLKNSDRHVTIRTSSAVALYILNQKRGHLNELEERFGLEIGVDADEGMAGQHVDIIPGPVVERAPGIAPPVAQLSPDAVREDDDEDAVADDDDAPVAEGADGGERSGRRRRRRRRRGGEGDGWEAREGAPHDDAGRERPSRDVDREDQPSDPTPDGERQLVTEGMMSGAPETKSFNPRAGDGEADEERRGRRRRGRRGGRRHRRDGEAGADDEAVAASTNGSGEGVASSEADRGASSPNGDDRAGHAEPAEDRAMADPSEAAADGDARGDDARDDEPSEVAADGASDSEAPLAADANGDAKDPAGGEEAATEPQEASVEASEPEQPPEAAPENKSQSRPRRVGWWRPRSFFSQ